MTRILIAILIMLLLVGLLVTAVNAKPACGWPHRGAPPRTCHYPTPTPTVQSPPCRIESWYCS